MMIKLGLVFLVLGVCSPFLLQQPIGFRRGLGRESGRVWGGVPLKSSRVSMRGWWVEGSKRPIEPLAARCGMEWSGTERS